MSLLESTPPTTYPVQTGKSTMSIQVTAEAILRSPQGTSILDAQGPITAATIADYRATPETINQVAEQLKTLGFQIHQTSVTSIAFSGSQEQFEQTFNTTLVSRQVDVSETPGPDTSAVYYEATQPIQVPESIKTLVAGIILPTPPTFFP